MSALATVLLAAGLAVLVIASVGLVVLDDAYARLHALGPVTTLGAAAVTAAIWVEQGATLASAKAGLVLLVLFATGPVLSHAIARAARREEER